MGKRLLLLTEDVEELKNELSELQVGDKFTFGDYHGPIEWRVLDKTFESLLIISEYGLDCKPFDEEGETSYWSKCSLKRWLNSEFFNKAFDSEEKSLIDNTSYGKIFCLSLEEAMVYFSSKSDRKCKPTSYALSQGATLYQGFVWWWLRSRGSRGYDGACVSTDGDFSYYNANRASGSVRPAMRLKI